MAGAPRWEFRIWHDGFRDLPAGPVEARLDVYLTRPGLAGRLVKLREGRLEVKELLAREEDGLECWRPEPAIAFPLGTGHVAAALCLDASSRSRFGSLFETPDALIASLSRWTNVTATPVEKRRVRVERAGCPGEEVQVRARGLCLHSQALEHEDAHLVAHARTRSGWDARTNESYGSRLQRGDRPLQPASAPTMRWSASTSPMKPSPAA